MKFTFFEAEAHPRSLGYAKTYIILPSTIYGTPSNALTKAGLQNTHSIQLPFLIKASIGRGQGGVVGKGAAKWNHVSNADGQYPSSRYSLLNLLTPIISRGAVHYRLQRRDGAQQHLPPRP